MHFCVINFSFFLCKHPDSWKREKKKIHLRDIHSLCTDSELSGWESFITVPISLWWETTWRVCCKYYKCWRECKLPGQMFRSAHTVWRAEGLRLQKTGDAAPILATEKPGQEKNKQTIMPWCDIATMSIQQIYSFNQFYANQICYKATKHFFSSTLSTVVPTCI